MTTTIDEVRAAFEADLISEGIRAEYLDKGQSGNYKHFPTQYRWEGYQAGRNHQPAQPPASVDMRAALEVATTLMTNAYNAWGEDDKEMLSVIEQCKASLSHTSPALVATPDDMSYLNLKIHVNPKMADDRLDFYQDGKLVGSITDLSPAPTQEQRVDAVGYYVHCTPELLNQGLSCADTPRRDGDEHHSHDHLLYDHPPQATKPAQTDAVKDALEKAAQICDEEGNEWDSDNLITDKNYAHACRARIRALIEQSEPAQGGE